MPTTSALAIKFDSLRVRYLAAKVRYGKLDIAFAAKYGSGYQPSWLKAGEHKAKESASAAMSKASDAFYKHLASFSPRDWSYGVPGHWVCESLTFEDAARPKGKPLSVVPPMSYGATRPMT